MLPVSDKQFWKERLEKAKRNGKLHYSVYLANPQLWEKIYQTHVIILRNLIKKHDRVLDAGCGYGRFAPLFEDYVGVDISPDLLAEAKEAYPAKWFVEANLKKLPFEDNRFDWAICTSIKAMIKNNLGDEEWSLMEKELKRVAKNVLILEYGDTGDAEKYEVL